MTAITIMANNGMGGSVTIASARVRQLLVYCHGKREGDWSCHHQGKLPIDRFQGEEVLGDIERRCRVHCLPMSAS